MVDLDHYQHRATSAAVKHLLFRLIHSQEMAIHLLRGMTDLQITHQGLPTQCLVAILRLSLNGQPLATQSPLTAMARMAEVLQPRADMSPEGLHTQ